jgi:hypothetical protein
LDWRVIYIIGKILKLRCLKWAHMTHLDIWNTSYGQKKDRKSNWQFDSRSLKVKNWPNFLMCRWHAKYCWKSLDEGYNFASDLILIGGLHIKLWGPKVTGVPTLKISGLPFGNPRTKCHLDVGFMERHIVYYKGEGGGFPQVWVVVNLVSPNLFVVHPSTKSVQTYALTNLLFGLCRSMWMIKCLLFFLVPSRSSSMPFYPQSATRQGACPNSLLFTLDL